MEKNIVDVTILNPFQAPKLKDLKDTTLDVKAKDKNGEEFIVEMQVQRQDFFKVETRQCLVSNVIKLRIFIIFFQHLSKLCFARTPFSDFFCFVKVLFF